MKKAKRELYLALTNIELPPFVKGGEVGYTFLCSFCRYGENAGYCDEPEPRCNHPLPEIEDVAERLFEGVDDDCWGFNPEKGMTPEVAADTVGSWLQRPPAESFRWEDEEQMVGGIG